MSTDLVAQSSLEEVQQLKKDKELHNYFKINMYSLGVQTHYWNITFWKEPNLKDMATSLF